MGLISDLRLEVTREEDVVEFQIHNFGQIICAGENDMKAFLEQQEISN